MENKTSRITRGRVLSLICLIVFVLAFIFCCMRSVLPLGAGIVGTFGWIIYPVLLILSFVSLAKFLGFAYRRSVKALLLFGSFVLSIVFVIHCIRTFSALDAVMGAEKLKDYILLPYSKVTALGLVGSVIAGIISLLLGAFGTIVVFVIIATLSIGLFVDFELYGKYEEKHIKKLRSRTLRKKVARSTDDVVDGSPKYSFSGEPKLNYDEEDVVASTSVVVDETRVSSETSRESAVVSEVQANPSDYESEADRLGTQEQSSVRGYTQYRESDYYHQDAASSEINSINFYGGSSNFVNQTQNPYENPFGRDAYSERPAFSDNVYREDYPDVFSSGMDETRRAFMEATFGGLVSSSGNSYGTEQQYASQANSQQEYNNQVSGYANPTANYENPAAGYANPADDLMGAGSVDLGQNYPQSALSFEPSGADKSDFDPFGFDEKELNFSDSSIGETDDFNIDETDPFGGTGQPSSEFGNMGQQDSAFGGSDFGGDVTFPGMIGDTIDDAGISIDDTNVSKVAGFGFGGTDSGEDDDAEGLVASGEISDFDDADEEPLVFGAPPFTEEASVGSDGIRDNERRDYRFLTKRDEDIVTDIENDVSDYAGKPNPQYSALGGKQSAETNNVTKASEPKAVVSTKPEFKKPNSFNIGMTGIRYNPPPISLLKPLPPDTGDYSAEQQRKSEGLEEALKAFNIPAKVVNIIRGPKITRYELSVPLGVPVKKVPMYELDIKRALAAKTINIQAPIAGSSYVGIELENDTFTTVSQRELMESEAYQNCKDPLPIAVGKDISGEIVVKSLTKMVHLLIAGSTGSGKSVFIHSIVMSLIYRHSPDELRLIMIDPKKVEFGRYNGLPHLLTPEIVMGADKAVNALKWCVKEMERRYDLLSKSGYNNIEPYNRSELVKAGQFERFPYIVIIVDEIAELMTFNKKEVEVYIQRITQLARACGMHMILATQRPSVDIISGVIKNNVPSRIAFSLTSGIDSKTILNTVGAEKLLGQGDMLFSPNGTASMPRLQAAFCSDDEIKSVIDYDIQNNAANYDEAVSSTINAEPAPQSDASGQISDAPPPKELDPYFKIALKYVMQNGSASTSYLQRRLSIGYSRAAKIIDQMEDRNYIAPATGQKVRKVLITPDQFKEDFGEDYDSVDV